MSNGTLAAGQTGNERSHQVRRSLFVLTILGGAAFWATNFMISRTPIAAEYRAALSISYLPMLAESLLGGLIIGFLVSYCLVRFQSTLGLKEPILRALALSLIALLFVTTVIEGPARFQASHDALHWFLIGASFNALRITALGITIGYAYRRMV